MFTAGVWLYCLLHFKLLIRVNQSLRHSGLSERTGRSETQDYVIPQPWKDFHSPAWKWRFYWLEAHQLFSASLQQLKGSRQCQCSENKHLIIIILFTDLLLSPSRPPDQLTRAPGTHHPLCLKRKRPPCDPFVAQNILHKWHFRSKASSSSHYYCDYWCQLVLAQPWMNCCQPLCVCSFPWKHHKRLHETGTFSSWLTKVRPQEPADLNLRTPFKELCDISRMSDLIKQNFTCLSPA